MLLRSSKKIEEVCTEYLEKLKSDGKKQSTRANYYQKIYKYLLPLLELKIKDIKKSDYNDLINILKETLSTKTINDIIILLNSILLFAFKQRYIKEYIKIKKIEDESDDTDDIEILTDEEQDKLIDYLLSDLNYLNFSILLTLRTGIRVGELSALTTANYHNDFIAIKYTLQRVKNIDNKDISKKTIIVITEPKTKKSRRKIPFDELIISTKKELEYRENDYIVTGTNHFMEPRTIENNFEKILIKCGINHRKFHILRHTFAMNCVRSGMSIEMLAELLGHSNIEVTRQYYIHYSLEMKRAELEKINKHKCNS